MRTIRRLLSVTTLSLGVVAHAVAQTPDRPPTQPAGLSAAVYGKTSGAVAWQRSTDDRGAVPGYEVTRDGVVVVPGRDALSHVARALSPGTSYRFGVTAIDSAGQRSAPAFVTLTTAGGASPSNGGGPSTPDASGLAAPGGLVSTRYSGTNGEISWDRPPASGLRYDVSRDGVRVTTTDGISHYDGRLVAGRRYRYDVVAIDRDGRRSAPATITLPISGSASGSSGGSPGDEETPTTGGGEPAPSAGGLAVPTGLRATVYSRGSGEVFWRRPATPGLRYVVVRDGRTLATTDGVSYYDDALVAGRAHVYEIVALDREGRRSAPASITLDVDGDEGATTPAPPVEPPPPLTPGGPATPLPPLTPPPMAGSPIEEPSDYYRRDGYDTVNVVRMDVRTVTTPGTCTDDDDSGCTLDDVNADNDPNDELTVEIPVHFRADDFPDDGREDNAELRQRGATARLSDQKSYRVELKGKGVRWRDEDRLQLNKNPYDPSKIRNKLAFDLIREIPNLPSMRTQFVDLWIDDGAGPEPYGLFTHVEAAVGEYLENRGWDEDDRLYKAEKFLYAPEDLAFMALDEDGEPVDEDAFESRLEIKGGDDHRELVKMIRAVNDREQAFEDVLARHFDEDNVITWVTLNILLRHIDGVTHNFYLYNPVGSEKFWIIPWDYDQTFAFQAFPTGGFGEEDLIERLNYGYARVTASNFLKQLYKTPGFHAKVLAKAEALRGGPLMDSVITERANRYTEIVAPVAGRQPDEYRFDRDVHRRFAGFVSRSHDALRSTYSIPLPPSLATPRAEVDRNRVRFGWSPAFDVTGGSLTYDLEVSRSAGFEPGQRVFLDTRIPDAADYVQYDVPLDRFPSGTLYARLVARVDRDPARYWQISSNREDVGGERRIGIKTFRVP